MDGRMGGRRDRAHRVITLTQEGRRGLRCPPDWWLTTPLDVQHVERVRFRNWRTTKDRTGVGAWFSRVFPRSQGTRLRREAPSGQSTTGRSGGWGWSKVRDSGLHPSEVAWPHHPAWQFSLGTLPGSHILHTGHEETSERRWKASRGVLTTSSATWTSQGAVLGCPAGSPSKRTLTEGHR